jgi:predicted ester cyclase
MGSKAEVVRAYHDVVYSNPPASATEANETYLSDDFKVLDQDGNVVMDKAAYAGMNQLIFSAFKDYKAVYSDLREEGDGVILSYHFEGTHTGDLDLSAMGLGVIPASGKKIIWPEASSVFMVEGDKIVGIKPYEDSGGIEDFLAPLGVTPPSA